MSTDPQFRTFCHISDYGEYGYRRLHRLVAGSKPLLLWSPSSVLLRACGSIAVRDYLKLLDDGVIRIIGRENWLLDPQARDDHRWEGARWDPYIDEAVRRAYYQDLHEPDEHKRVILVEEEPGQKWAIDTVQEDPGHVEFWSSVLHGPDAAGHIPPGTLEAIRHGGMTPEQATVRILRDARNHGQAVQDSRAQTPFLLSPADARFLQILAEVRENARPGGYAAPAAIPPTRVDPVAEALASQLIAVLERLDECAGERSLMAFIRRGGHDELVAWLVELRDLFAHANADAVEAALVRNLAGKLRRSRREGVRALFDGPWAAVLAGAGAVGAANTVAQALSDANLQNLLGLAVETLLTGAGTLKTLGFMEGAYSAPQWPYLYTYGRRANRTRRRRLLDNLAGAT